MLVHESSNKNKTKEINAALEIKKLDHQRFNVPGGYIQPNGYALKHPEYGYLGFKDRHLPYNPIGGKQALKEIVEAGGFTDFDDVIWLKPIK
ncbi:hypothetical protein [Paenibacillus gallinarum]|uniref:Uncharacterized protein n=1 Tax=Paenibacillus gallinarum TaxID=2762232 RepID=A0ABR8T3G9_9BACL|nr:hypothetical protein [Paenibacillus gallinarum]MBD7970329.1 hypothetical protein [Paenibacillus gallinarum]